MPTAFRVAAVGLAVLTIACVSSCAATRADGATDSSKTRGLHSDSAGGLVVAPSGPYAEATGGPASLIIQVAMDSTVGVPSDATCEVDADSSASGGEAVVWVDGIRRGKPLSNDRRYELVSSGCALSPRVQAVLIGGTINVFNDDAVIHRLIFTRAGTSDTLQMMPFANDGEIVASDRLARTPGIIQVQCAQHPQERAYIVVFDHPYFDVTVTGGKVRLDSVPAGDYQVRFWREGMSAPSQTPVTVGATGVTQLTVR